MSDRERLAEVLAEHMRGDWSDHTYSCQGCRNRFEDAEQAKFDAMDREPTRDELMASRNAFSEVSHPGWSFADYNAHVADALAQMLAEARAEAVRSMAHLFRDMAHETLARRDVITLLDLRADSYGSALAAAEPDAGEMA